MDPNPPTHPTPDVPPPDAGSPQAPSPTPSPTPPSAPVGTLPLITGPLSVGELLDRTFRILRARFGVLILSAGIVLIPLGIISALLTGNFMTGYFDFLEMAVANPDMPPDVVLSQLLGSMGGYVGSILLLSILSVIGNTFVSLIAIYHAHAVLHNQPSDLRSGLRAARPHIWRLIGLYIVRGLAIALLTLAILTVIFLFFGLLVVLFGLGLNATGGDGPASVIGMIVLIGAIFVAYILVLIVVFAPGMYLSARWIASIPALMLEQLGPVAALRRSWHLTQGHFWRSVGVMLLLTLIGSLALSMPVAVVQQIAAFLMPDQLQLIFIFSTVSGYLLSVLWQPLFMIGLVLLYYDLRVRGEGYDVQVRVEQLEQQLQEQNAGA